MDNSKDKKKSPLVIIAALGVVYGDIGTSPLYAFRECFNGEHAAALNENHIYGILSLICWSLILIVTLKYLILIMRADNQGEGGILALMELVIPKKKSKWKWPFIFGIGLFGAALLYGDGILTPAISVLGAVEGLELVAPNLMQYVVPITVVILLGLFWLQTKGTAGVGRLFGPIMLLWFIVLGATGVYRIIENPTIFEAINPMYAFHFIQDRGWLSLFTLGAIFLVVTGGEAMYADLGHFGLPPIRKAWFSVVLPGLLLNYFGQGALLLQDPSAVNNPFFSLAPEWGRIPLIVLATAAAIIASQAIISGVFSLTFQAVQLRFLPRLRILHTSKEEKGQVYLPKVNFLMMVATILVVVMFKSSSNLAGAYGIAIVSTMVITDVLAFFAMRGIWKWSLLAALSLTVFFLFIDLAFLSANALKIIEGGWFPLLVALLIYLLFRIWIKGRRLLSIKLSKYRKNTSEFLEEFNRKNYIEVEGTAIFMTGHILQTPLSFHHNLKHNGVIHEKVIFLEIGIKDQPYVSPDDRLVHDDLGQNFHRVLVKYGYFENIVMRNVLDRLRKDMITDDDKEDITFFLAQQKYVIKTKKPFNRVQHTLFRYMSEFGVDATKYFGIPAEKVFEIGIRVEL